jgi:hypothetical protein
LRFVTPIFEIYKPRFQHCDRIRQKYDPNSNQLSNIEKLFEIHQKQKQSNSFSKIFISSILKIFVLPFHFIFNSKRNTSSILQYPSTNIEEKAHNDGRLLKFKSFPNAFTFFTRNLYHFYFAIPKQVEIIQNKAKTLSNQH